MLVVRSVNCFDTAEDLREQLVCHGKLWFYNRRNDE